MIKVRAKMQGFYGNAIRETGSEFMVDENKFSDKWMEKVKEPSDKRHEDRDPGEHDQNVAKKKGWGL